MSKLAHSYDPTMVDMEFKKAVADGNEDCVEGFYWVRHQGEVRVAEWRHNGRKWAWDFTRAEEARVVDQVLEPLSPPP